MYGKWQTGFTLIELLMVIVVLSVSSLALVRLFGQIGESLNINRDLQAATQLAQECAEHLLSARRAFGFAMGGIGDCATTTASVMALTAFNGNGPPDVVETNPYAAAACPALAQCKLFTITANYSAGTSVVTLLVANY
ncbi:MAG: type II secretion system protein [Gammaproteobacteria bacterium]|nr:type II secretion system protein [Gammaproteobacteria bacterium]